MDHTAPNQFTTLSECVDALQEQGYTDELMLTEFGFTHKQKPFDPNEFDVDTYHRFEGDSDPADMGVVYAISNRTKELKGLLVGAYGSNARGVIHKMVGAMNVTHNINGATEPVQPIAPGANVKIS